MDCINLYLTVFSFSFSSHSVAGGGGVERKSPKVCQHMFNFIPYPPRLPPCLSSIRKFSLLYLVLNYYPPSSVCSLYYLAIATQLLCKNCIPHGISYLHVHLFCAILEISEGNKLTGDEGGKDGIV